MTRREFEMLAAGAGALRAQDGGRPQSTGSQIGNVYPFVQKQADRSPIELSFLRPEFRSLPEWQKRARAKAFEHMFYTPAPVAPDARTIGRVERDGYTEERITFQTTPDLRVPAYVLVPRDAKLPAPGIVALHDHGAFYMWGKEKLLASEGEHPALAEFRRTYYGGKSIASELARQGYVVISIDMFYWGDRRMLLDDDPPEFRERPSTMPERLIQEFNRRSQQDEQLVARSLFQAGITWPGVMLWDDIRTVDYLVARPEVDRGRIACVGLSVGGYRSYMLAALDERIRAAVSVGFMRSDAAQIRRHVINSTGLTFHLVGLFRYLDLPDISALIAPRPLLMMNGSRDGLFNQEGLKAAYDKIGRCYAKAGARERQVCRLYDVPHQFNAAEQEEAWQWLRKWV